MCVLTYLLKTAIRPCVLLGFIVEVHEERLGHIHQDDGHHHGKHKLKHLRRRAYVELPIATMQSNFSFRRERVHSVLGTSRTHFFVRQMYCMP